jgi:hypothetical protein
MGMLGFLTAVGIGAGLMYLLDPQAGARRRKRVAEQVKRRTAASQGPTAWSPEEAQQGAQDLTGDLQP